MRAGTHLQKHLLPLRSLRGQAPVCFPVWCGSGDVSNIYLAPTHLTSLKSTFLDNFFDLFYVKFLIGCAHLLQFLFFWDKIELTSIPQADIIDRFTFKTIIF